MLILLHFQNIRNIRQVLAKDPTLTTHIFLICLHVGHLHVDSGKKRVEAVVEVTGKCYCREGRTSEPSPTRVVILHEYVI